MKAGDLSFVFAGCEFGRMMGKCLEGNGKNKFLVCLTHGAVSDGDQVAVVGCRVGGKGEDWLAWILSIALCPNDCSKHEAEGSSKVCSGNAQLECSLGQGDVGRVSISTAPLPEHRGLLSVAESQTATKDAP